MNITSIPLAKRRPVNLPVIYTARENDEWFVISYEPNTETCLHVDMKGKNSHGKGARKNVEIALKNLGGYVFETEYPGEYQAMIRRWADNFGMIPVKDQSLWERFQYLTGDKTVALHG